MRQYGMKRCIWIHGVLHHCYVAATSKGITSIDRREKKKGRRPNNNYLCRCVLQEKCCSSLKAVNRFCFAGLDVLHEKAIYRFVSFFIIIGQCEISIEFFWFLLFVLQPSDEQWPNGWVRLNMLFDFGEYKLEFDLKLSTLIYKNCIHY